MKEYKVALDNTDIKIIHLLVSGCSNKEISSKLNVPLSTIQRRTRNIIMSRIISSRLEPNFKRLGLRKGLLHIHFHDGDIRDTAVAISKLAGVLSSSVHVGNSDIVASYVYEDSQELINTISALKHMHGIDSVLWSEEIFSVPINGENIISSFGKIFDKSKNKSYLI